MTGNSASNHFRPLLPQPLPRTSIFAPVPTARTSTLVPKRSVVKAACEGCRQRKAKCDAKRPSCSACIKSRQECEYTTGPSESRTAAFNRQHGELKRKVDKLQDSHNVFDQLFQAIQSRSEAEAGAIFKRIRGGGDCESILRHISVGDILLQLHVTPETRYRYVFPYKAQMPASLLSSHNPYLQSLLYEMTFATSTSEQALPSSDNEKFGPQYLRPLLAAEVVDARLDSVKPSMWTNVSTDDDLMRTLLRSHLLFEYDSFIFFHKDYFLDDMVQGSNQFCSPLLVNAVLALACHCYRALPDRSEFWNPQSLAYKFSAEAKRLWELELTAKCSLTTLQATVLIGLRFNLCGMDNIGSKYLVRSIAMAHDLRLFEEVTGIEDNRMCNSRDYTAWCLFNWQSLYCYHIFAAPLIKEPPKMPLPDPEENPYWYSDVWIKYPLKPTLYPMNYGHTFKAASEFCVILNRISLKLFDNKGGKATQSSREAVVNFIRDFTAWYVSLPDPLTPKKIVFPSQICLHLQYYVIMLNLWKLDPVLEPPLDSPHTGIVHIKMCFETLIRLYYLRHGSEAPNIAFAHYLQILSFMSISTLKTQTFPSTSLAAIDDVRATLILTAKGLSDQGRNYYLSETIFYIIEDQMSSEDTELLRKFVHVRKEDNEARWQRAKHSQSQIPLDVVKITEHPEDKLLGDLALRLVDKSSESTSPAKPSDTESSP